MGVKTSTEVKIYERDGEDVGLTEHKIVVSNHWNRRGMVDIYVNGGLVTVHAADLRIAIDNAERANG
jgi:F0F1-type ATP synthase epsilon subunit